MRKILLLLGMLFAFGSESAVAQAPMKFFVTGGKGPDVAGPRGIRGADDHCATLGYNAGFGDAQWRAFLDAPAAEGQPAVRAKDRIGAGPWHNFYGVLIAENVEQLLSGGSNLNVQTALNERGEPVYSAGSSPAPAEILATAKPDANGLYFCFAE